MFDSLELIVCKPNRVVKLYDPDRDLFGMIPFLSYGAHTIAVFPTRHVIVEEQTSIRDFCIEHLIETDHVYQVCDFDRFDIKDVVIYEKLKK